MIDHLSQSMLKSWLDCRAKFYDEYILGMKTWEPYFDQGSLYHKAVENYHLHGKANALIQPYIDNVAQDDFLSVERKFKLYLKHPETDETLPIPFTGIVDRIASSGLHDFKTSSVSWSQARADSDIQATAYLYAWWQSTGKIVPFWFDIQRKDYREGSRIKPFMTVQTTRDLWNFKSLWLLCSKVIDDIAGETNWACSCRDQVHRLEYIS